MSNMLAGFVKGVADYQLDSIQKREEAERERKKAELLEQLRRDTAKELAVFQDGLNDKKADDKLSGADMDTGEFVLRNSKGTEIGRRKMTEQERMREDLEVTGKVLDQDYKRALISQSEASIRNMDRDDARAERQLDLESEYKRLQIRKGKRELDDLDSGDTDFNETFEVMRTTGANEFELSKALSQWENNKTRWTTAQKRTFLNELRAEWAKRAGDLAATGLAPSQVAKPKKP